MRSIQRDAFVISVPMKERVRHLNQAVRNCELLFVLTPSGSGMDAPEFQEVLLRLVRQNLNAVFAEDVDQDEVIQEAANWTQGIWRLLTEQLIRIIDEELGPAKSDASRVITKAVWERVRKRWEKHQW